MIRYDTTTWEVWVYNTVSPTTYRGTISAESDKAALQLAKSIHGTTVIVRPKLGAQQQAAYRALLDRIDTRLRNENERLLAQLDAAERLAGLTS